MNLSLRRLLATAVAAFLPIIAQAQVLRTVNVSSSSQLASAVAAAQPGDDIVLANGSYAAFTITRDGTAANPISIRAANRGQAIINSGVLELNGTSYITINGLGITTSGGARTTDGESYKMAVWLQGTDHCRVTRCTFHLSGHSSDTHWVLLGGHGDANRIDHCEFGPNSVQGHYIWPRGNRTIPGVTPPSDRTSWANGNGPVNPNIPLNTRIDHNYFHDQASGAAEVIVLGGLGTTGDYQNYGSIVEENLFVNCDGDPEFVSVKSSGNFIRFNTARTCSGMISLRAGNKTVVSNNILLQGGKSGAGGIKIYEKDHTIYNNYIDNASEYPILIGRGDPYTSSSFAHAQVFRAKIVNNTVVNLNNRPVIMGHGGTSGTKPTDITFANNLVQGTASTLYQENESPAGASVFSSNIFSAGSAHTGFIITNPQLTTVDGLRKLSSTSPAINAANESLASFVIEDQDGQDRNDLDIGADEFSSQPVTVLPLTTADVGPASPDDEIQPVADPIFTPAGGSFSGPVSVTITSSTSGASIRYTTDGSTPTATAGTLYSGAFTISSTTSVKAIAFKSGLPDSGVSTATYTITNPSVAAPIFNPAPGTFNAPVTVSMSTSTGGASIRYTTDGSMPTSSSGTVYTGPITISATTPLNAIAYATGLPDSTVTSGTYTINTGGGTLNFEAESLTRTTSGTAATTDTDTSASGGARVTLNATATGSWVEFTLPNVPAGTYSLQLAYKTNNNRGQATFKVDGNTVGGTVDQYATAASYPVATIGTVTFGSAGNHLVRLTVAGKNSASSSFTLSADKFILIPTTTPPPTLSFEAESLTRTTSGTAATTDTDASASGGARVTLNATSTGSWVEFTLPNVPAGTYSLQLAYKTNNNRGQATFKVDGNTVGGTLDQYAATSSYPNATIGTVTFASTGNHLVRLTVAGKNSSSSSFTLSADKFTLVGQ
jgi:poly(beta-D-mannuronate) lyase